MALMTKLRQVAIKAETTRGTAQTLAAADSGMLIATADFAPDFPLLDREILKASLGHRQAMTGTQSGTISIRSEVKGGGAAGSAPKLGLILKAAGMAETIAAGTSAIYDPVSTGHTSVSAGVYVDDETGTGLRHTICGAMAQALRITGNLGEPLFCEAELRGKYVSTTDTAPLTPTYETLAPPILLNATFTCGGFAAKISTITIDFGLSTLLRQDITEATGFTHAEITDRLPTISFETEQTLVATHDWIGRYKDGTEGSLNLVVGSSAGNIVTITAPKVQYTGVRESDRDGVATFSIDGRLNESANTGNDEIKVKFT